MKRTVEDDIIVDQVEAPEIIDDFELDQEEVVDIKDKEINKHKLLRRIGLYKVCYFHLPFYLCLTCPRILTLGDRKIRNHLYKRALYLKSLV